METVNVSLIADTVGDIFEFFAGLIPNVVSAVSSNPLLLIYAILPLVGLGVGLFKRLINVN